MPVPALLGLGNYEVLLLLFLILILFGAKRLPNIGSSLGKGIKNFRKGLKGEDEPQDKQEKKTSEKEN